MPRAKKQKAVESRTKQRAREDIPKMLDDAMFSISEGRWEHALGFIQDAVLLTKALTALPVKVRTIKQLPKDDVRYSQSLEKGLKILALFTSDRTVLGIAEVADCIGLTRSTTHRYMISLVGLGQLEQTVGRKYRLVEA